MEFYKFTDRDESIDEVMEIFGANTEDKGKDDISSIKKDKV